MTPSCRPYQVDAITNTKAALAAGKKRILLTMPTGGGKTVVAAQMIREMLSAHRRILFVAHRRELIKQTVAKLSSFSVPCGIIMAGERPNSVERVQVASIQTIMARAGKISDLHEALNLQFDYIIYDEAHHVTPSNGYGRLADTMPNARIIGLTATPWRLDGKGLGDVFDYQVMTRTPLQLMREGFLVPVSGWFFRALDTTGVGSSGGDYNQSQLANVENNILGDVVKEWLARIGPNPVPTIIFAAGVKHSRQFVEAFRAAGVSAEHVDGETPVAERDAILERVRRGQTLVLSNCNVATEGFDLPTLTCCVLARPTKSLSLYLQMVGRVLRPDGDGKPRALLLDHSGCLEQHGHPYDPLRDYSMDSSARRKRGESFPSLHRCQKCGVVVVEPDAACPECGYAPPKKDRSEPGVDTEVEAVDLADRATAESTLSYRNGIVSFKKKNEFIVGVYTGATDGEGMYGPERRYHFEGRDACEFTIIGTADLKAKMKDVPKGHMVRVQFLETRPTPSGFQKKLFKILHRSLNAEAVS